MNFLIADTFQSSLARLTRAEQKAAKTAAIDLKLDPTGEGKSFHRRDRVRDIRPSMSEALVLSSCGDAWTGPSTDTSRQFPRPSKGRIAVQVINHLGDKVMKVFGVCRAS